MAFQTTIVNYKSLGEDGLTFGDGVALNPLTTAQAAAATPATGDFAYDTDKNQVLMGGSDTAYHSVTEIPHWTKTIAGPLAVPDSTLYYVDVSSPDSSYQLPTVTSGNTGITVHITQGIPCFTVTGEFAASAAGSYRYLGIQAAESSGGTVIMSALSVVPPRASGATKVTMSRHVLLPPQYAFASVSVIAYQDSGGPLNLSNVTITCTASGTVQDIQFSL